MGKDVFQMKEMPNRIKKLLRQYDNYNHKARTIHQELNKEFEKYGVPYDNLVATSDYSDEPSTEGLAFINNVEGNIEDNIELIEEVFLYFVNKKTHS